MNRRAFAVAVGVVGSALVVAGCGSSNTAADTVTSVVAERQAAQQDPEELFPDVLAAEVSESAGGGFTIAVTMSSPYDTPERYADAFRVLTTDGEELGVRVLTHDHANEQPFTRSLTGVDIPDGVTELIVEGRDQVSGWGGGTVTVAVPGR